MADREGRKVLWPDGPGIFDLTPEQEAARDERAMDDFRAGRTISNEAVRAWLIDLAEGKKRPRPKIGE